MPILISNIVMESESINRSRMLLGQVCRKGNFTAFDSKTDLGQVLEDFSTYLAYHRGVSKIRESFTRGKPLSPLEQRGIISKASKAEEAFCNAIDACMQTFAVPENRVLSALVQSAWQKDFQRIRTCTHPSFYGPNASKLIADRINATSEEMTRVHGLVFGEGNCQAVRDGVVGADYNTFFDTWNKRSTKTKGILFPESPDQLHKEGVLQLSGNGEQPTATVVGISCIVVGTAVIVASGGLAAGLIPAVIAITTSEACTGVLVGASLAYAGARLTYTGVTGQPVEPALGPKIPFNLQASTSLDRYYGNILSKELHVLGCRYLEAANERNIRTLYGSIDEAHQSGFDNCALCLGDSHR